MRSGCQIEANAEITVVLSASINAFGTGLKSSIGHSRMHTVGDNAESREMLDGAQRRYLTLSLDTSRVGLSLVKGIVDGVFLLVPREKASSRPPLAMF